MMMLFILTLFCLPQYVHDKRSKFPQRKFTVKSCDCRCYMDSSRQKTNDKDKFQFWISEYECNAPSFKSLISILCIQLNFIYKYFPKSSHYVPC